MSKFTKTTLLAAALASALPILSLSAAPASAQVTSCDAPGGRQEAGAAIGAVLGGVLGSQVAKNSDGAGAAIGALGGAAAGSYVGCKQQQARARTQADYSAPYGSGGYYATANMNVRAGPSTRSPVVDHLGRYERFDVASHTRGGWVKVVQNGAEVGYISNSYVRPVR